MCSITFIKNYNSYKKDDVVEVSKSNAEHLVNNSFAIYTNAETDGGCGCDKVAVEVVEEQATEEVVETKKKPKKQ